MENAAFLLQQGAQPDCLDQDQDSPLFTGGFTHPSVREDGQEVGQVTHWLLWGSLISSTRSKKSENPFSPDKNFSSSPV